MTVYEVALSPDAPGVHQGELMAPPAVHAVPMPVVRSQREPLATTPATATRLPLGIAVASQHEAIDPVAVSQHRLAAAHFTTRVHGAPPLPPVRVHRDLAVVRAQVVLKRAVPARAVSPELQSYWLKRLGDAKRVSPRMIELVGLFPDVPLRDDQPVRYRADQQALAYPLPESPVPLSTVVVARHRTTGEVILGRFHKGA